MLHRIRATGNGVKSGFPHYANPDTGEWVTSTDGHWTGGFWVGLCWLAHLYTGDPEYLRWAERWADYLRERMNSDTVTRAWLFYYGAALGDMLHGSSVGRELALAGSDALARSYNRRAGLIPVGTEMEEAHGIGPNETEVDLVAGVTSLLAWAANETGKEAFRDIAISHAKWHVEFSVREDGSVQQSATFDPCTGALLKSYTHKGFTDSSTWARAQAWAMLGFSRSASRFPGHAIFLETAVRVSEWWLQRVPPNGVPYWDFDVSLEEDPEQDTSASAIAVRALLELSALVPTGEAARRYKSFAQNTTKVLLDEFVTPIDASDTRMPGILTSGCFDRRTGLATRNELIWGDYFLFESLLILNGTLSATFV